MLGGDPALVLADEDGKVRINLTVSQSVIGLVLNDDKGRSRAGLTLDKNGPHLVLKDDKGKIVFSKP
jgi:hypothetical protein